MAPLVCPEKKSSVNISGIKMFGSQIQCLKNAKRRRLQTQTSCLCVAFLLLFLGRVFTMTTCTQWPHRRWPLMLVICLVITFCAKEVKCRCGVLHFPAVLLFPRSRRNTRVPLGGTSPSSFHRFCAVAQRIVSPAGWAPSD